MSTRRTRFSPLLAVLLAVAAALLLLLLSSPAPGYAQTVTTTYISNIDQGGDSIYASINTKAQSFATGSQTGGYTVTHVDIGSDDPDGDAFSAAIYTTNASGHPVSEVAALTPPSSFAAGTLTFTAPANTTLEASTTYTVRIVNSSNNVTLDATTEDAEDPGGATGWSIGNDGYFLNASGTWVSINRAIRIAIRAEPKFVDFSDLQTGHTSPIGMWSPDGSTLWVGQWFSTQVYAYNLADETANYSENWTLHNPATVSESNRKPTGIWSNGTHIYVTDPDHDRVFQYNAGDNRQGLWSDGTTAWVSDNADDKLYAYQLSDFSRQSGKDIDLHSDNGEARGIWSDGTTIWVLDRDEEKIYAYTLSDGSRDSGLDIDLDGAGENYNSIWSDGTTMYVVENTSGSATRDPQIHKLPLPAQDETVVWEATLALAVADTPWSTVGNSNEGYGSSASPLLSATHGTLSPDSFTVGSTTHTVEILAYQTGSTPQLLFFTDTGVTKADLEGLELRITVDGVAKTLAVSSATDFSSGGTNYGIYWEDSSHGYRLYDWAGKTVTVQLRTLNNAATGAPTISGTAVVGEPMRAVTSGIMDSDGLTSPTYAYQWIRVDGATESDISGATSSTYTPVAADLGKTIKVKVSFTDDASNAETLTSTATTAVTAAGTVNNPATGAPTITGTAQVGQTLTAATSGIMDSDGLATPGYTYQWIRVDGGTDANISGATSITYTLVAADLGKTIKVKVSFTDDASNAETLTSTATAAVTAAVTDDCAETTTTTCSVSLGSSVTGDIESNNDADYFSLALTSGVTYQIDAEGSDTSKGTLDDPFLYLRNASGTELASNEDGGTGRNARIVWTATSTETGYVDVQDSSATNTGTYTLTVSVATVPDAIADLSTTPGNTQVTLSWTAFDDGGSTITKFEYRQKTSGSYGSWMDISNSPSTVSHTVTGLTNATAYTFQVRAMNGVGNAGVSNEATATPGYAQSAANVTYVSNIGQGSDDDDSSSQVRAQTFTTGSRAGGYTVTSVDIGSDDAEGDSFTANLSITDPTSGNPVAKVATLTVPTSFTAGTLTFIAPPYTVLEPNTTYSVTITVGSNNVTLDTTLSNGEDSGRTSGWSIANTSHRVDGGDWAETTDGESIRIAINGPANPARGAPTITGTAQVGETLTAVTSAISDPDGLTSPVYTYQWIRVDGGTDAHITGATSSTYVPVAADTGKTIRVRVRFTDDLNYSEQRTSAATAAVNAPATGEPTISGITQVGETLTADPSLIMDANGLTSPGYTYQWIRVDGTDTDISGATSNTYTLVVADNGKTIKVRVRFSDDDGYSEERTSAATAAVSPPPPAGLLVSIAVEGDEQIIDQFIIGIGVSKAKFRVSIPAALTANLNVTINISEVSDTRTDLGNAQTADHVAAGRRGQPDGDHRRGRYQRRA